MGTRRATTSPDSSGWPTTGGPPETTARYSGLLLVELSPRRVLELADLAQVSRVELAEEARAGRFAHDTLVWCPGMPDWKPASEVPGVAELNGPPPVPEAEPPSPEPSA